MIFRPNSITGFIYKLYAYLTLGRIGATNVVVNKFLAVKMPMYRL